MLSKDEMRKNYLSLIKKMNILLIEIVSIGFCLGLNFILEKEESSIMIGTIFFWILAISFTFCPPLIYLRINGIKRLGYHIAMIGIVILSFIPLLNICVDGFKGVEYYWLVFVIVLIPLKTKSKKIISIKMLLVDLGNIYLLIYSLGSFSFPVSIKKIVYITIIIGIIWYFSKNYLMKEKKVSYSDDYIIFNKTLYYHYSRFIFWGMVLAGKINFDWLLNRV